MLRQFKLPVIVALIAALLSFAKFEHCRAVNWVAPDVDTHMCYSDLPALFGARDLNHHTFPYASGDKSVEYPVIMGLVMWGTSLFISNPSDYRGYFDLNILLIALLLIASTLILWRLKPEYAFLATLSPPVIASLFINWDMWAIVPALLALYWFKERRFDISAVALSLAISTKFFPAVILVALSLALLISKEIKTLLRYLAIVFGLWLLVNLPIALTYFDGWKHFYAMNINRPTDLGSIWLALSIFGIGEPHINYLTIMLFLIGASAIGIFYKSIAATRTQFENIATTIFLLIALFTTVSKVYSPQYVLWLVPFAIVAMTKKEERIAFWVWQGGEFLYHVAIWQYLAASAEVQFALSPRLYAWSIVIRIATLLYFCATLARSAQPNRLNSQPQFLVDSTRG